MNQAQRIPVVALTLDESVKRYNEFDISNKVREKGWILSAYFMPQSQNCCSPAYESRCEPDPRERH
jgi:hypothetical protein